MQNLARRPVDMGKSAPRFSLADIARKLDVPVVIVTFSDVSRIRNHSTFGLDFAVNWSEFAAAIDHLCGQRATVIPNVENHDELGKWTAPLVAANIRFLAGTPLYDFDGWRVGSIAALASQQHVARKGIAMRELAALGREFVGIAV